MTAPSQEALHAATQQAESMVQHKTRMRHSQIAAQTPLPQQGAKAAPTEAQQRLRTAAEPKRVGCCIISCNWLLGCQLHHCVVMEPYAHFAWPRQHPVRDAHALDFRTDASHFVC